MAREGLAVALVKRRAKFSEKNKQIAPWPSRGGMGSKLKSASRRFSEKMILRRIAAPSRGPGCAATTTRVKRADSGSANAPAKIPMRIASAAKSTTARFAGWTGQGHPSSAAGVLISPARVVGSAAPADHPSAQNIGENGYNHGAEDFAANVRQRIQRHLPTFRGREIATPSGDQGMRGFMTGQRKEERNVPEKAQSDEFRFHGGQPRKPPVATAEVGKSNYSCPTERVNITYQGRPVVFRLDAIRPTLAKGRSIRDMPPQRKRPGTSKVPNDFVPPPATW